MCFLSGTQFPTELKSGKEQPKEKSKKERHRKRKHQKSRNENGKGKAEENAKGKEKKKEKKGKNIDLSSFLGCFDLSHEVDEAVALFGDENAESIVLLKDYSAYY